MFGALDPKLQSSARSPGFQSDVLDRDVVGITPRKLPDAEQLIQMIAIWTVSIPPKSGPYKGWLVERVRAWKAIWDSLTVDT